MKPDYGVVVGRFQVNDLHDGHMELFRQVRARHSAVIVFIGMNQVGLNQADPLDYPTRRAMIQAKFPDFTVLPLQDKRTDDEWSRQLDDSIAAVTTGASAVTLYGGRKSFVPHYRGRFAPIELAMPIETTKTSGTDVRLEFSNKVLESPEFRAGMIYASTHRWPDAYPCVDVAIMNDDETEVLLGRKTGEREWRFIGGHFEPRKHLTWEMCAKTEVLEETGLEMVTLEYVGGGFVDDWRNSADQSVATVFFKGRAMGTGAKPMDDIAVVMWHNVSLLNRGAMISEHRVLYDQLMQALRKEEKAHAATTATQPAV